MSPDSILVPASELLQSYSGKRIRFFIGIDGSQTLVDGIGDLHISSTDDSAFVEALLEHVEYIGDVTGKYVFREFYLNPTEIGWIVPVDHPDYEIVCIDPAEKDHPDISAP